MQKALVWPHSTAGFVCEVLRQWCCALKNNRSYFHFPRQTYYYFTFYIVWIFIHIYVPLLVSKLMPSFFAGECSEDSWISSFPSTSEKGQLRRSSQSSWPILALFSGSCPLPLVNKDTWTSKIKISKEKFMRFISSGQGSRISTELLNGISGTLKAYRWDYKVLQHNC